MAVGKDFEKLIETDLEVLRQIGTVRFFAHTEVGYRKAGPTWIPVAPGFADYSAVCRGGIAAAIEVKSRASHRFAFNELPEKQVLHLDAVAEAGGVAVLALEFRTEPAAPGLAVPVPQRFAIPWARAPWQVARSARALHPEDCAGFAIVRPFLASFIWSCPKCRFVWPLPRARCLACGAE